MAELSEMIRDYCEILAQERALSERKEILRAAIDAEMARQNLDRTQTPSGSARYITQYKLLPKREPVLKLLSGEDLFPFTRFTPARVKEILVPKFGRETLIPLFEIQKSRFVLISRVTQSYRR
jgi:hypothetical protein